VASLAGWGAAPRLGRHLVTSQVRSCLVNRRSTAAEQQHRQSKPICAACFARDPDRDGHRR
jgi:hypothetical protein